MQLQYIIEHIKLSNICITDITKSKEKKRRRKIFKEMMLNFSKFSEKCQSTET